jgi:hypothetical protein
MVLKEEIALLGKKNKLLFLASYVMAIINDFGSLLAERTKLSCPTYRFVQRIADFSAVGSHFSLENY